MASSASSVPLISSRMMKSGSRNRPYAKDLHDLFATLIVSLRLIAHRTLFRSYPYTFTTDEAVANLSALKFSQSMRQPDPLEPNRVITTTTTTTFTMNRDIAKDICQHFLDAHLISSSSDRGLISFRDKGIWALTHKGYCVLERFVSINGISADHLEPALAAHRPPIRLVFLDRRSSDDEINIRLPLLDSLFRRFAGPQANYPSREAQHGTPYFSPEYGYYAADADSPFPPDPTFDRARGVEVADVLERLKAGESRVIKHAFSAMSAVNWLLDFTSACGRDEAAELLAHFERLDLIKLVADKTRTPRTRPDQPQDPDIVTVRGADVGGMITEGDFRCHYKSVYALTDRGRQVARWEGFYRRPSPGTATTAAAAAAAAATGSSPGAAAAAAAAGASPAPLGGARPTLTAQLAREDARSSAEDDTGSLRSVGSKGQRSDISSRVGSGSRPGSSSAERASGSGGSMVHGGQLATARDQGTRNRLRQILGDATLCHLFQAYLRRNFCEENLSFYLDVQDFKHRFSTTSSASAVRPSSTERHHHHHADKPTSRGPRFVPTGWLSKTSSPDPPPAPAPAEGRGSDDAVLSQSMSATERHHLDLIVIAFLIFNTYLAPGAPAELNLEHALRTELLTYMHKTAPHALERPSRVLADEPGASRTSSPSRSPRAAGASVGVGTLSTPRMAAVELGLPEEETQTGKKVPVLSLEERKKLVLSRVGASGQLLHASQLQTLLRLYSKIQEHVFQLMATDSVPRFVRDPAFLDATEASAREHYGLPPEVIDLLDLDSIRDSLPPP